MSKSELKEIIAKLLHSQASRVGQTVEFEAEKDKWLLFAEEIVAISEMANMKESTTLK